jgi:hypothetical protein
VIVSVGEAVIVYPIPILKKLNDLVTEGIAIVIVIETVNGDDHEATTAIAIEIVNEINGKENAIAEIEKIVAIVKMRIQKKSELRKSL